MKNRFFLGFGLGLVVLLLIGAVAIEKLAPRVFLNLASLDAAGPSISSPVSLVLGRTNMFDWGMPRFFKYEAGNSNTVSEVERAVTTGVGRNVHSWDTGDVRVFGAIPYHPKYTLMPWGWQGEIAPVGASDFTVYVRAKLPSTYTTVQGLFEISPVSSTASVTPKTYSAFGMRAGPTVWGFVFRSTNGLSSAGSLITDAAVLESSPAALSAWAGLTVDMVITRQSSNAAVYFNGVDVTSSFTLNNPSGWAKPLALSSNMFFQVGNNINPWYWTQPIERFCFWGSALNSTQAANPSAVGSKLVDFTPNDLVEPPDLTASLNAVSTYIQSKGGGEAYFPPGVYRVGGTINIGRQSVWHGPGGAPYSSTVQQAHRPGAAVIFQWINATNTTFLASKDQGVGVFLQPTAIVGATPGKVSSTWLRSSISDLTIAGTFGSADAIAFDRVGSFQVKNVHFYNIPGYDIRAYAANAVYITGCTSANAGRGVDLRGCADLKVLDNFFDSGKGPMLRWYSNLGQLANNVFEISQNPRITVPPYEYLTTVDPITDEFTVSGAYGHLLNVGTVVRFDADGTNVLAGPLNETIDYYAIPTGPNTFKVSTILVAEDLLQGAYYGNSFLDITNSGTGVWYSGVGPSVNIHLSGDHNAITGNHGQQGWEGGLLLDGTYAVTKNNTVIGNHWMLSGPGNTDTNGVAALRMINASQNAIIGNQLDDRDLAGYSQNGVIADTNSINNTFFGNSWNVDNPYNSNLYVHNSILDGQTVLLNSGRVLVTDGVTTNIQYLIQANTQGAVAWSATNPSGTLTALSPVTGTRFISMRGRYVSGMVYGQVDEDSTGGNSTKAFSYRAMRNGTNLDNGYAPLTSYQKLGGYESGGWRGFNAVDFSVASSIDTYTSSTDWNLTNAHSQMHLNIVPPTTAAQKAALILQFSTSGRTDTNATPMLIGRSDGTNWVDAASGWAVTLGTNNSGGPGKRTLLVPNN